MRQKPQWIVFIWQVGEKNIFSLHIKRSFPLKKEEERIITYNDRVKIVKDFFVSFQQHVKKNISNFPVLSGLDNEPLH